MTTMTRTFTPHYTRARRHSTRSFWRDVGAGLAVVLLVLIMTVVATRGTSSVQPDGAWLDDEPSQTFGGWETVMSPELFPGVVLTGEVVR
jgi:hypothetical protein